MMAMPPPVTPTLVTPWTLARLLAGYAEVAPYDDRPIAGLALDSRRLEPGQVFIALPGTQAHGLHYAEAAIAQGAAAILYPAAASVAPPVTPVPCIAVPQLAAQVGKLAARFYGEPSAALAVIGVTGTNGKTSCCHYMAQALDILGRRAAVIGTLGYGAADDLAPATHTTPDAIRLQALYAEFRARGCQSVVMEVSSHALDQGRVTGTHFHTAVWTNLSRDHLDYHGDMARYAAAKRRLFASPGLRHAVINLDDAGGRETLAALPADIDVLGYTLAPAAALPISTLSARYAATAAGLRLSITGAYGTGTLDTGLIGRPNAYNLLASLGALLMLGSPWNDALHALSGVRAVPGRLERLGGTQGKPLVIVDYAHTPDALEQALHTLRPLAHGDLWCVFGCGGARDAGKRPLMGAIAERLADRVILTDDNPRHEDPTAIIDAIRAGMGAPADAAVVRPRAAAIAAALNAARPGDVVLVAGKGHEDYQELAGVRQAYSDRAEVARLLGEPAHAL